MANRFGYGYTPALGHEIQSAGGPLAWFNRQLKPNRIPDAQAESFDAWFPKRHVPPAVSAKHAVGGSGYGGGVISDHARWALLRRTYSNRHVLEVMTEFWENHLHVYGSAGMSWFWRTSYDGLIRTHALGRFDQMLQEAVVHPTMLTYLAADLSRISRRHKHGGGVKVTSMINENLGRELLECHTVGLNGGYTEAQVTDSARILTGYHVVRYHSWAYSYQPQMHYTGQVKVMGFSAANKKLDGRKVTHDYLQYLAHHPATAHRIASKLAVRFVSDYPSAGLVKHLATVFRESGTDIKKTLHALVSHPEFAASVGKKVRTPNEDLVATMRVLGVKIHRPTREQDAANVLYAIAKNAGQVPFGWVPPNGFPDSGGVWSSAARMMSSYRMHYTFTGGWYPESGVTFRSHASWLPVKKLRFDAFVDHLCRELHGRPSTSPLLGAASIATDVKPAELISRSHPLIAHRMPKLLGILLDTPQHMTR